MKTSPEDTIIYSSMLPIIRKVYQLAFNQTLSLTARSQINLFILIYADIYTSLAKPLALILTDSATKLTKREILDIK